MNSLDNPYNPGAGTPPPELAGREELLQKFDNSLQRTMNKKNSRSMLLLGLRGVGKTVLLNHFDEIAEENDCHTVIFEADPDKRLAELITPQMKKLLHKLHRLKNLTHQMKRAFGALRAFASAFKVKYEDVEFSISNESATGDLALDLTELFVAIGEAAKARKTVALILIDEVQFLTKADLSAMIMALHKLAQKKLPLMFVGAGLPQIAKLAGEAKSYAERLFDYNTVGSLPEDDAKAAIVKPASELGVQFNEDALEKIVEETEGYPFFLQVWGSLVWDTARKSPVTIQAVQSATKKAIKELDNSFFKVRFDRLTARQKKYARAMAELGPEPASSSQVAKLLKLKVTQAAPIREELIKKGMAYSPARGLIAFTVPKFDEFMRRAMTFQAKKSRPSKRKKPRKK